MNRSTYAARSSRTAQVAGAARPGLVKGGLAALALLGVAALTPGCTIPPAFAGTSDTPTSSTPAPSPTPSPSPAPSPSPEPEPQDSPTSGRPDPQLQAEIADAVDTVDDFWAAHWTDHFTGTYSAPTVEGTYDATDPTSGRWCGSEPPVAQNALYCERGDFVEWDQALMSRYTRLGNTWIYLVVAHEWGHAMQAQLEDDLEWDAYELQADCLAGATLAGAEADGEIELPDDYASQVVADLTEIADETPWTSSQDHGDALERTSAFNLGRTGGVDACEQE